jgi:hypothetical protein
MPASTQRIEPSTQLGTGAASRRIANFAGAQASVMIPAPFAEKNHNGGMSRLEHEFSALAGAIENAAPNERARIARAAATAAVEAAQVDDDAIVEALT